MILRNGVNPNITNNMGYTPLFDAVKYNQIKALQYASDYNQFNEQYNIKFDFHCT